MLDGEQSASAERFVIRNTLVFSRLYRIETLKGGLLKFTFLLDREGDAVSVFMERGAVVDAAKEALLSALGINSLIGRIPPKTWH